MKSTNKLLQETQQQQQETEQIPQELIQKFDNDKQLVQEFMEQGYSIEELQGSEIIHPTKFDPIVMLDGNALGFWIDPPIKMRWKDNSRTYQNRFRS
jgi:hypothetical protein